MNPDGARIHLRTGLLCEAMCGLVPSVGGNRVVDPRDQPNPRVNDNLLAPPDLVAPLSNNGAVNGIPVRVTPA